MISPNLESGAGDHLEGVGVPNGFSERATTQKSLYPVWDAKLQ
jgi:hypothetical protein